MRERRPSVASVHTLCRLVAASSGLHLVIWLTAGVLDLGLIGVHPLCGDVMEVPIRQASGLPAVLDWGRTQGCVRTENDCPGASVEEMCVVCLQNRARNLEKYSQ